VTLIDDIEVAVAGRLDQPGMVAGRLTPIDPVTRWTQPALGERLLEPMEPSVLRLEVVERMDARAFERGGKPYSCEVGYGLAGAAVTGAALRALPRPPATMGSLPSRYR
jgi:hypothetical protein